jgi:hypothetical protein
VSSKHLWYIHLHLELRPPSLLQFLNGCAAMTSSGSESYQILFSTFHFKSVTSFLQYALTFHVGFLLFFFFNESWWENFLVFLALLFILFDLIC